MKAWEELAKLAARQHSVVTRQQMLSAGLTPRQIWRRLDSGLIAPMHRGVYRLAGAGRCFDQDIAAACLASGGVASHRAAAKLFALRGIDQAPVEITVQYPRQAELEGVVVHRTQSLPSRYVSRLGAVPITVPARILLDLAAVSPHLLPAATEDALFRGLVRVDSLWRVLEREGRSGRDGTGALRDLLMERDPALAATESPLEDAIVAVLRAHGEPEPVRQHVVTGPDGKKLRLDIAYLDGLVNIEGNGLRWHSSTADLQRDYERDNYLASIGWAVLRYTWHDVRRRPAAIAGGVRSLRMARLGLAS